ncbi:MAG: HAD-IC family P-type ATPase, partial [Chloroflexota bacterium]|nr:HAD-IC family P-type ATPase [Chloroflexota bacterium]
QGVRARVGGATISVGNRRLIPAAASAPQLATLEAAGKSILLVARDAEPIAILGAADTLRPEVPAALAELRRLGVRRIELLTGDNERTAAAVAGRLGVAYRANLLPEDKIALVKEHQAQGRTVAMIGDGVNDAPALAQADVGIAMGAAGSDVAIEAAHVALMRDDWSLVPELFRLSRRTMGVVRLNLGFTAAYNAVGLSLAAFGILPPVLAAAAQGLPDLGILANSARLLRQRPETAPAPDGGAVNT